MRLNDKKKTYSARIFESKTIKIMKVTIHVHFHRSCKSCFPVSFAKMCPKKVDLHRSLKVNCDHYSSALLMYLPGSYSFL